MTTTTDVQARFLDPAATARAVMSVLALGAVLDVFRLVYVIAHRNTPEALPALPHATVHFFIRAATAILFIVWLERIRRNLAAFSGGAAPSRWYFAWPVPLINEVWFGSGVRENDRSFPRLAAVWWVMVLIPPLLVVSAIGRRNAAPFEVWLRVVVAESMNVVAALLAIAVVRLVSDRQRIAHSTRKAALRPASAPPPDVKSSEGSVVAEAAPEEPMVTIAPVQPLAGAALRRRPSLEMMIRAQTLHRGKPLRHAIGALRSFLARAARR